LSVLQGKWTARKIPNPNYFEDLEPYKMTPIVSYFTLLTSYIRTWSIRYVELCNPLLAVDEHSRSC